MMVKAAFRNIGVFVGVFVIFLSEMASAVSPSLNNIMPRGGQRGTDVQVQLQGGNLADAVDLMFHDAGIELVSLDGKEGGKVTATLRIAPDCQLGTHPIRIRTATGISNLKLFSVGNLKELNEKEPNSQISETQTIEFNSTVNGVVKNEDVDYFSVQLEADQRIAVEVEALRLGHKLFDIKAKLFDPAGRQMLTADDTAMAKQDVAFVATTKEAGAYTIALSEASYGGAGNFNYRLHIGNFPRPLSVTPMGGQAGQEVTVKWLGDPGIGEQKIILPTLDTSQITIGAQSESGAAPTESPFRLFEFPGVVEAEPNNGIKDATPGTVPGAFDGVIGSENDRDRFSFEGKKGQVLDFRVWARELGSPLDSVLVVFDSANKRIASDDDARGMDSYTRVTLPADGKYSILVRDHLGQGGEAYAYRVEASPVSPELVLSIPTNESVRIAIPQGNKVAVVMSVVKRGFDTPVDFVFDNLPAGVTAEVGILQPGQTTIPILFSATPEAPIGGSLVGISGTAKKGETVIAGGFRQRVPLVYGRNKTVHHDEEVRRIAVAVVEPAPYSLAIQHPKAPVIKGNRKQIKVVAQRSEGFTAPIKLKFPFFPKELGGGTVTIAEGATEATILVEGKSNAAAGEIPLSVLGESAGYVISSPYAPIPISDPWITVASEEIRLDQGKNAEVKVVLTHATPFEGEYEMVLDRLPKGVTAPRQKFKHGTTELVFPLTVAADAPDGKHGVVAFGAILNHEGETVTHAWTGKNLTIFKPLPPQLQKKKEPEPKKEKAVVKKVEKPKRRTRFPETVQ